MKKTRRFILAIAGLLVLLLLNACGARNANGIPLSVRDFEKKYAEGEKVSLPAASLSLSVRSAKYSQKDGSLQLKVSFTDEAGKHHTLDLSGQLYRSNAAGTGHIAVGDMTASDKAYEVIRLEICDSTDCGGSAVFSENLTRPHVKLYLKKDQQLYLFETAIPDPLRKAAADEGLAQCRDSLCDILWFARVLPGEYGEETVCTDEKNGVKAEERLLHYSYRFDGSDYAQYIRLKGICEYGDVDTDAETSWTGTLIVTDAYCEGASGEKIACPGIALDSAKIAMALGSYTRFTACLASDSPQKQQGSLAALVGFSSYDMTADAAALFKAVRGLPQHSAVSESSQSVFAESYADEACRALDYCFLQEPFTPAPGDAAALTAYAKANNWLYPKELPYGTSGERSGIICLDYQLSFGANAPASGSFFYDGLTYFCDLKK